MAIVDDKRGGTNTHHFPPPWARRHLPRAPSRPGQVSFAARPESHLHCPWEGNERHWEHMPAPQCPQLPTPKFSEQLSLQPPKHTALSLSSSPAPKIRAAHSSGAPQAWILSLLCDFESLTFMFKSLRIQSFKLTFLF